jgi:D-beta-D-heptose 7-phosphate kinase/D-beta-D-heptose 1-phosphate adenosyltransferase
METVKGMAEIVSHVELKQIVQSLREKKKKIAFTCGCFDLLHIGHIRTLKEAKSYGDVLIVGVNSDDSVRHIKGELRPIIPEGERAELVASLTYVDFVTIFSESTPETLIALVKPDVHVKAGYALTQLPEADLVTSYGGKIILATEVNGYSTTMLIKRILQNYC